MKQGDFDAGHDGVDLQDFVEHPIGVAVGDWSLRLSRDRCQALHLRLLPALQPAHPQVLHAASHQNGALLKDMGPCWGRRGEENAKKQRIFYYCKFHDAQAMGMLSVGRVHAGTFSWRAQFSLP